MCALKWKQPVKERDQRDTLEEACKGEDLEPALRLASPLPTIKYAITKSIINNHENGVQNQIRSIKSKMKQVKETATKARTQFVLPAARFSRL